MVGRRSNTRDERRVDKEQIADFRRVGDKATFCPSCATV